MVSVLLSSADQQGWISLSVLRMWHLHYTFPVWEIAFQLVWSHKLKATHSCSALGTYLVHHFQEYIYPFLPCWYRCAVDVLNHAIRYLYCFPRHSPTMALRQSVCSLWCYSATLFLPDVMALLYLIYPNIIYFSFVCLEYEIISEWEVGGLCFFQRMPSRTFIMLWKISGISFLPNYCFSDLFDDTVNLIFPQYG